MRAKSRRVSWPQRRERIRSFASAEMGRWPNIFVEDLSVVFRGLAAKWQLLHALAHENLPIHPHHHPTPTG